MFEGSKVSFSWSREMSHRIISQWQSALIHGLHDLVDALFMWPNRILASADTQPHCVATVFLVDAIQGHHSMSRSLIHVA